MIDVAIEGGLAQQVFYLRGCNLFVGKFTGFGFLEGQFAESLVHLLLQLSHTALTGILLNNLLNGSLVERQFLIVQTGILLLLRNKVTFGNLVFFLGDIAADLNDFHTVE